MYCPSQILGCFTVGTDEYDPSITRSLLTPFTYTCKEQDVQFCLCRALRKLVNWHGRRSLRRLCVCVYVYVCVCVLGTLLMLLDFKLKSVVLAARKEAQQQYSLSL